MDSFSTSLRYQLADTNVEVLQAFLPLVDTSMTAGRGQGKINATEAALKLIKGIEKSIVEHDIGKVKFLRFLNRLLPNVAKSLMSKA